MGCLSSLGILFGGVGLDALGSGPGSGLNTLLGFVGLDDVGSGLINLLGGVGLDVVGSALKTLLGGDGLEV